MNDPTIVIPLLVIWYLGFVIGILYEKIVSAIYDYYTGKPKDNIYSICYTNKNGEVLNTQVILPRKDSLSFTHNIFTEISKCNEAPIAILSIHKI